MMCQHQNIKAGLESEESWITQKAGESMVFCVYTFVFCISIIA